MDSQIWSLVYAGGVCVFSQDNAITQICLGITFSFNFSSSWFRVPRRLLLCLEANLRKRQGYVCGGKLLSFAHMFFFYEPCKTRLKKKWGGCQFGPSTNSCTVLLKVLCIPLINGAPWLISPWGQIRIPQHHAAKLVWYCTFLTGYQQGCSSGSQDASHPLPSASPPSDSFRQNLFSLAPLF